MEQKIRALVVEDNVLIGETICETLAKNNIQIAGMVSSGEEAISFVDGNPVDIVLMDIHLEGPMDGISAASSILKKHSLPVIYLTDFTDKATVERAKKTFPSNYLAKPFNEFDLVRAIEIAFNNFYTKNIPLKKHALPGKFFFRTDTGFVMVAADEILYLQAERSYCQVVMAKEKLLLSTSMNHIHSQLGEDRFIRIQRSYVVNLHKVCEVNGNMIKLEGGHQVQMSKEFRDQFFERLKIIR